MNTSGKGYCEKDRDGNRHHAFVCKEDMHGNKYIVCDDCGTCIVETASTGKVFTE